MKSRGVTVGLAVLSLFVSGCVSGPEQNANTPDVTSDPPPPISLPLVQYLDCTHVILPLLDSPRATVEAAVPDEFEPQGLTPATAGVNVFVQDCDKSLDNRSAYGPTRLLWSASLAQPVNESWHRRGFFDYYILDYAVSAQGIVDFFAEAGIETELGTFQVEKSTLPEGTRVWAWQVVTEAWKATLHHRLKAEDTQSGDFSFSFWFGDGPFRRAFVNVTEVVDTLLNENEIVWEGESRTQRAVGSPAKATAGSSYVNSSWQIEIDPIWYGA